MKDTRIILLVFAIAVSMLIACEIDHGLSPTRYTISGTVKFLRGSPPENTDRLEVYAIKEFPPQDPQNFIYLGQSGGLNISKGNQLSYEIQVSPTTYDAIVLLWKEKGYDISLTGLIGIYTTQEQYPFPVPVTVTKESPQAVDIDIFSDWDKVSKDASIGGTITYQGDWPEDTELLLLVVYRQQPTDALSLLFFENIDYTQSLFVDSSEYRLLVSGAEYQYVVLFWVGKNISDFEDLIELGFYENPQQPGQPGIVDLREGGDATDIDISVNFNNVIFPK